MTQITLLTGSGQAIGEFDFPDLETATEVAQMYAQHDLTDIELVYSSSGKRLKKVKTVRSRTPQLLSD